MYLHSLIEIFCYVQEEYIDIIFMAKANIIMKVPMLIDLMLRAFLLLFLLRHFVFSY